MSTNFRQPPLSASLTKVLKVLKEHSDNLSWYSIAWPNDVRRVSATLSHVLGLDLFLSRVLTCLSISDKDVESGTETFKHVSQGPQVTRDSKFVHNSFILKIRI